MIWRVGGMKNLKIFTFYVVEQIHFMNVLANVAHGYSEVDTSGLSSGSNRCMENFSSWIQEAVDHQEKRKNKALIYMKNNLMRISLTVGTMCSVLTWVILRERRKLEIDGILGEIVDDLERHVAFVNRGGEGVESLYKSGTSLFHLIHYIKKKSETTQTEILICENILKKLTKIAADLLKMLHMTFNTFSLIESGYATFSEDDEDAPLEKYFQHPEMVKKSYRLKLLDFEKHMPKVYHNTIFKPVSTNQTKDFIEKIIGNPYEHWIDGLMSFSGEFPMLPLNPGDIKLARKQQDEFFAHWGIKEDVLEMCKTIDQRLHVREFLVKDPYSMLKVLPNLPQVQWFVSMNMLLDHEIHQKKHSPLLLFILNKSQTYINMISWDPKPLTNPFRIPLRPKVHYLFNFAWHNQKTYKSIKKMSEAIQKQFSRLYGKEDAIQVIVLTFLIMYYFGRMERGQLHLIERDLQYLMDSFHMEVRKSSHMVSFLNDIKTGVDVVPKVEFFFRNLSKIDMIDYSSMLESI